MDELNFGSLENNLVLNAPTLEIQEKSEIIFFKVSPWCKTIVKKEGWIDGTGMEEWKRDKFNTEMIIYEW